MSIRYLINGEEVSQARFDDELESAVNNQARNGVDDWIDEISDSIQIGSLTFFPSEVLKKCDPIAYSCTIDDYASYINSDAHDDLLACGEVEVDGITFSTEEVEDEEETQE